MVFLNEGHALSSWRTHRCRTSGCGTRLGSVLRQMPSVCSRHPKMWSSPRAPVLLRFPREHEWDLPRWYRNPAVCWCSDCPPVPGFPLSACSSAEHQCVYAPPSPAGIISDPSPSHQESLRRYTDTLEIQLKNANTFLYKILK